MRKILLGLALLLFSQSAFAQGSGVATMRTFKFPAQNTVSQVPCNETAGLAACPILNGVAANASAANRTFTLYIGKKYSILKLQLLFTWSAATAEVLTCSESLDGGAHFGNVTSTSVSAGTGTVSIYTDNRAVGANDDLTVVYDVRGDDQIQCVWSATGGGASDTVKVFGVAAVGY